MLVLAVASSLPVLPEVSPLLKLLLATAGIDRFNGEYNKVEEWGQRVIKDTFETMQTFFFM